MLRQRVITALILAIIGLSALFLLPAPAFAVAAALLLAGIGGWEAARLTGLDANGQRIAVALALLGLCLALSLWLPAAATHWALLPACAVWLLNMAWLARPTMGQHGQAAALAGKLAILAVILASAWLALAWLQGSSPWLVVMLLILIAAADTFAYFTGRHFGGLKLAPRISPGKTRSGAAGGLIGATALTALSASVLPDSPFTAAGGALVGLGLGMISIVGDLFISLLKRQRQLKDTSELLPGHGGILDRFDSLTAALPFFALAVMLWGQ
jgi:phosphatidate cytidylyltransferase